MNESAGDDRRIRSAADAGRLLRDARRVAGTTQQRFAARVGVSRQWLIRLERGDATARLSSALAAFAEAGLTLVAEVEAPPPSQRRR